MVQSIDGIQKPVYSAVNISITKPEVNAARNSNTTFVNDNGIYNSVKIDIDNPTINTEPKKVYDYPENDKVVTYDMLGRNQVALPAGFPFASYYETTLIIPQKTEDAQNANDEIIEVPEENYTTLEAEKGEPENDSKELDKEDNSNIQFKAAPDSAKIKKPEIIPPKEIKPDVDISLVTSNLENSDFDVQAQQMEEIARIAIENPKAATSYIVKDVFSDLIEITKKDTSNLAKPNEKQIEARKKIIANVITAEIAAEQNKPAQVPYQLSENEIMMANEISPMEQAERNKEYAIYTMAILAKIYTDEIEKETGNVVPFTDVPGLSDMVDALRYNPNSGVKIAAIDGLRYIQRPEYKQELNTIFSIAKEDEDPQVSAVAEKSLRIINK